MYVTSQTKIEIHAYIQMEEEDVEKKRELKYVENPIHHMRIHVIQLGGSSKTHTLTTSI